MSKNKKHSQLGMNPSTAQGRLVKDILWNLILKTNQHLCCKCNKEMSRETFSIEHLTPWLDSDDPVKLFFDLENISFSHLSCNVSDARKMQPTSLCGQIAKYSRGCRCALCKESARLDRQKYPRYRGKKVKEVGAQGANEA